MGYPFKVNPEDEHHVTAGGLMRGFEATTTVHGVPHVSAAVGRSKTFVWCVISLTALGVLAYHMYSICNMYFSYGMNVKITIQEEYAMDFPAVTFCNLNPIKKSNIGLDAVIESLLGSDNSNTVKKRKKRYTDTSPTCQSTDRLHEELGLCYRLLTDQRRMLTGVGQAVESCSAIGGAVYFPCSQSRVDFMRATDLFTLSGVTTYWNWMLNDAWANSVPVSGLTYWGSKNLLLDSAVSDVSNAHLWTSKDQANSGDMHYTLCQDMVQCPHPVYDPDGDGLGFCWMRPLGDIQTSWLNSNSFCPGYDHNAYLIELDSLEKMNHFVINSGILDGTIENRYWLNIKNLKWKSNNRRVDWNNLAPDPTLYGHASNGGVLAYIDQKHQWFYGTSEDASLSSGMVVCEIPNLPYVPVKVDTTIKPTTTLEPITLPMTSTIEPISTLEPLTTAEPLTTTDPKTTTEPTTMITTTEPSPATVHLTQTLQPATVIGSTTTTEPKTTDKPITGPITTVEPITQVIPVTTFEPMTTVVPMTTIEPMTKVVPMTTIEPMTTVVPMTTIEPMTTSRLTITVEQATNNQPTTSTIEPITTVEQTAAVKITTAGSFIASVRETTTSPEPTVTDAIAAIEPTSVATKEEITTKGQSTTMINAQTTQQTSPPTTPSTTPVPVTLAVSSVEGKLPLKEQFILQEAVIENLAVIPDELKILMGYTAYEFIIDCTYEGSVCSNMSFHQYYSAIMGNCYIFNSGWNNTEPLYTAKKAGRRYGLSVIVNIGNDEYVEKLGGSSGARIVLTGQNEMPHPEQEGIFVEPGKLISIGIRKVVVERLGPPHGNCTDQLKNPETDVFSEVYPVKYSTNNCKKTCYQKKVIDTCGCGDSHYPLSAATFGKSVLPCDINNITQDDCKYRINSDFVQGKLGCTKKCPDVCSENYFTYDLSTAKWPSDAHKSKVVQDLQPKIAGYNLSSPGVIGNNLITVEVYFDDFSYEEIREIPAYPTGQFASDVGGILGLWIGMSVITVFEFIELFNDLLILIVIKLCYKQHKDILEKGRVSPVDISNNHQEINFRTRRQRSSINRNMLRSLPESLPQARTTTTSRRVHVKQQPLPNRNQARKDNQSDIVRKYSVADSPDISDGSVASLETNSIHSVSAVIDFEFNNDNDDIAKDGSDELNRNTRPHHWWNVLKAVNMTGNSKMKNNFLPVKSKDSVCNRNMLPESLTQVRTTTTSRRVHVKQTPLHNRNQAKQDNQTDKSRKYSVADCQDTSDGSVASLERKSIRSVSAASDFEFNNNDDVYSNDDIANDDGDEHNSKTNPPHWWYVLKEVNMAGNSNGRKDFVKSIDSVDGETLIFV